MNSFKPQIQSGLVISATQVID